MTPREGRIMETWPQVSGFYAFAVAGLFIIGVALVLFALWAGGSEPVAEAGRDVANRSARRRRALRRASGERS
jgi:hypothetical protein